MAWRKIQKEDIKLGAVLRNKKMIEGGSYGMATIIDIELPSLYSVATLARPYAYAKDYGSQQPLLGAEVYGVLISRLLSDDEYEVFQERDNITTLIA